ncbi:restriction endonuclease subunit S [Phenylobacterium sp.]|uniref:restriction endonuclease subunit S n=1 Tax=Phenylobacterium sp. TaxID=1871053 RepID=UPI002D196FD1|nr:restriction endonuclease subunit S [Phenylobacterium sp.]HLZ74834.1 restriction endonuclease subunit S [Phenylobacterium sp.]
MSFSTIQLSSVADVVRTGVDPKSVEAGTRYVGLEHISGDGRLSKGAIEASELASTKFAFNDQQVLFGKLRPYLRKIARPTFDGICSTDIIPIMPSKRLDRDYLFHFLRTDEVIRRATSMASGANLPRIHPKVLLGFEIPLPPLDEQRRIAAILDQADALRRVRREAMARLTSLKSSLFIELFGDPVSNPLNWPLTNLGRLLANVTNGMTRRRGEGETGDDIVLRLRDIRDGWIDFSEVNRITLSAKEKSKFLVSPTDLLFIRVNGNPDYVGRCSVFSGHKEKIYFNDHIMRVSPKFDLISPVFLQAMLDSQFGRDQITTHKKTSAGQHTINQDGLSKIEIPLPPLALQTRFASELAKIDIQARLAAENQQGLDALFASLQHRAFRGEL